MACNLRLSLNVGNNSLVELRGLKKAVNGDPITDANVLAILYDTDGNVVPGHAFPALMLPNAPGENDYFVTLDATLAIVAGRKYRLTVEATSGDGVIGFWDEVLEAQTRRDLE